MPHELEGTVTGISGGNSEVLCVRADTGLWCIKLHPDSPRAALNDKVRLIRRDTSYEVISDVEPKPARVNVWPYNFVRADVKNAVCDTVRFHHGVGSKELKSGVLKITWTVLTPTLVGHEQVSADTIEDNQQWELDDLKFPSIPKKAILPLRADWLRGGPVIWPGPGIKGTIRSGIASLLASPMERVAERHFTYRPNLDQAAVGGRLVRKYGVICSINPLTIRGINPANVYFVDDTRAHESLKSVDRKADAREVPNIRGTTERGRTKLSAASNIAWSVPDGGIVLCRYHHGADGGAGYMSAFRNDRIKPHPALAVSKKALDESPILQVPDAVVEQYKKTFDVMTDDNSGHRLNHPLKGNPYFPSNQNAFASLNIDDAVVLEVDGTGNIVTMGHYFNYRIAYADSVRQRLTLKDGKFALEDRPELREFDDDKLSATRRMFGFVAVNAVRPDNSSGQKNLSTMAGRIAFNHALEDVDAPDEGSRFLNAEGRSKCWVAFPQQGSPKPSAVEGYLLQDDTAPQGTKTTLKTYGDTFNIDGEPELHNRSDGLRGRKIYLHQDAVQCVVDRLKLEPQKVDNLNALLGRFVSKPGAKFKSVIYFSDCDPWELGALYAAIDPASFVNWLRGLEPTRLARLNLARLKRVTKQVKPKATYALKFGFGRPLGLGSVVATIDNVDSADRDSCYEILLQKMTAMASSDAEKSNVLYDLLDRRLAAWIRARRYSGSPALHYPTKRVGNNENIFTFHTSARKQHAIGRRGGASNVSDYILTPIEDIQ